MSYDNDDYNEFSERMSYLGSLPKKQRYTLHYNLEDIADAIGVTMRTLQRWIASGKAKPIQAMSMSELAQFIVDNKKGA